MKHRIPIAARSCALALTLAVALDVTQAAAPAPARACAGDPPSRPWVDTPELAALGSAPVGYRVIELTDPAQPDVMAFDPARGTAPDVARPLTVDLWYPARVHAPGTPVTYTGALDGEQPGVRVEFTVFGLGLRDAPAAASRAPLVLVSHGLGNDTAALTWLTENLASKGYVVAAVRHHDPSWSTPHYPELVLRRPLDLAFVARELKARLARDGLIDPQRVGLIGYSMGGYTVLTAAGATLDPQGPLVKGTPVGPLLAGFARGSANGERLKIDGVGAVVALAPAGGGKTPVWGAAGLAGIRAPLLLIAGDHDLTVDYASNARSFLDDVRHAPRWLLTYREGGHAIGLGPSPPEMRGRIWDLDWFEDPVWRKSRIVGTNLHFITAFLDLNLRHDESRRAYLEVPVTDSSAGSWTPAQPAPWDAVSPGGSGVTLWKGFQRRHATGLELLHREAEAP